MNPRTILSVFPARIQQAFFYRFFNNRQAAYPELFKYASLKFAPGFQMKNLIVGDSISGPIAFTGCYELGLSREIQGLSRKGGVFVDVGANLGYYSLLWLNGNKENKVIAFEASQRNESSIKENIDANNLNGKIRLFLKAAGDKNGKVFFDAGPQNQTGWGGLKNNADSRTVEIDMVRLDDILKNESYIDVIKIDVEGADFLVIKGCEQLLRQKKIGRIYFEENAERTKEFGIELGQSKKFLENLNYLCEPFQGSQEEFVAIKD